MKPITVIISSRNRSLYLWACLDALYRGTKAPHRFVIVDMASTDPQVFEVIDGFERRGMFHQIVRFDRNDPALLADFIFKSLAALAPVFAYIESDVVVEIIDPCWLTRMSALMEAHPSLAMLGSAIDRRDFVDPAEFGHLRQGRSEALWRGLIKADSPERLQDPDTAIGHELFRPHNPAGRLLLLRSEAILNLGLASDDKLDAMLRERGYGTAIATSVRHRHLSLTQIFDYPDYDLEGRNRYMESLHKSGAILGRGDGSEEDESAGE